MYCAMSSIVFAIVVIFSSIVNCSVYRDISYYPPGTAPMPEKNKLDIYVPDVPTTNMPVIFFVHGGSWMYNDRSDFEGVGYALSNEEGFVTVVISYRLSSDTLPSSVVHPDHITDVAQAFRWTVDSIIHYGGDPNKIFIMGHSAGAHLVALLATNTFYLEAAGCNVSQIKGVIPFSIGVYDIPGLYNTLGIYAPYIWPYTPFPYAFGSDRDNWVDASPKYFLHDDMPPFVLYVAVNDMEHIIGGTYYGVTLPGEINLFYNDINEYQPTDSFWFEGDHNSAFADFILNPSSRQRNVTMNFINNILAGIDDPVEKKISRPFITACPNPFNASCRISAPSADVIQIIDMRANVIESINGSDIFIWKPGKSVANGVYFIKALIDNYISMERIIYIK